MGIPIGVTAYDLAYQVSPIIFTGGIASSIPGGALPVIQLLGLSASLLLSGSTSAASFPYRFLPVVSGTKVINQSVATYPFANNQVASNAVVEEPKPFSLLMIAPVNSPGGYLTKFPLFYALQTSFAQHNAAGGTYTIVMPSTIFYNCIMAGVTDVTQNSKQQQIEWRIDFIKPLVSLSAAAPSFSSLMQKITDGNQLPSVSPSGTAPSIGSAVSYGIGSSTPSVAPLVSSIT